MLVAKAKMRTDFSSFRPAMPAVVRSISRNGRFAANFSSW
jgi:hypothetical protein